MRELDRDVGLLDDAELIAGLNRCVLQDRVLTAELLVHFGELDARGLYRGLGYDSMFTYAVNALHMSESEAMLRIRTSRFGREFPVALEMLARGELHLTAFKLLGPVLTQDNLELLDAARFKSKREILELLAAHFPRPDVPSMIRRLPGTSTGTGPATQAANQPLLEFASCAEPREPPPSAGEATTTPVSGNLAVEASARIHPPPSASSQPVALSADRYKIQFTASRALRDKVTHAQDLLRHQLPKGDLAQLFERALDLLIAQREKALFAQTRTTRKTQPSKPNHPESRHIPHAVRREVLARDGRQCCFIAPDGERCAARGHLEFHHREPYARGGSATSANIQLLCRAHNQLLAERDYGRNFILERITHPLNKARQPVGPDHLEPNQRSLD